MPYRGLGTFARGRTQVQAPWYEVVPRPVYHRTRSCEGGSTFVRRRTRGQVPFVRCPTKA
eukprot:11776409-Alexandrium_andersonii.AAC.1